MRPFLTTGECGFFWVSNVTYGINIAALFFAVKRKTAFRFAESGIFYMRLSISLFLKEFNRMRNFVFICGEVSFSLVDKAK